MTTLHIGRIRVTPSIALGCLWVLVAITPKHDPSGPPWYFQRYLKLHPRVEALLSWIKRVLDKPRKRVYNKAISRAPYIGTTRSYTQVKEDLTETTVPVADKPPISEAAWGKEVSYKPLLCEVLKREGPPSDRDLTKMRLVIDVSKYLSVSLKEATKTVEDMENFYSTSYERS